MLRDDGPMLVDFFAPRERDQSPPLSQPQVGEREGPGDGQGGAFAPRVSSNADRVEGEASCERLADGTRTARGGSQVVSPPASVRLLGNGPLLPIGTLELAILGRSPLEFAGLQQQQQQQPLPLQQEWTALPRTAAGDGTKFAALREGVVLGLSEVGSTGKRPSSPLVATGGVAALMLDEDCEEGPSAEKSPLKRRRLPLGRGGRRVGDEGFTHSGGRSLPAEKTAAFVPATGVIQHPSLGGPTLQLKQQMQQLGTERLSHAELSALLKQRLAEGTSSWSPHWEPSNNLGRGPSPATAGAPMQAPAPLGRRRSEPIDGDGAQQTMLSETPLQGSHFGPSVVRPFPFQVHREAEREGRIPGGPPQQEQQDGLMHHAPSAVVLPVNPSKPHMSSSKSRPPLPEPRASATDTHSGDSLQQNPPSPALSVQRPDCEGSGVLKRSVAESAQQREATSELRTANSLGGGVAGGGRGAGLGLSLSVGTDAGVPMLPPDPSLQHLQFLRFLQRPPNPPSKWASWPISLSQQEGLRSGSQPAQQQLDLALGPPAAQPAAPASAPSTNNAAAAAADSERRQQQQLQQLLQRYHSAPAQLLQKELPYDLAAGRRHANGPQAPQSDPWGATVPPQALSALAAKASAGAAYSYKTVPQATLSSSAGPDTPQSTLRTRPQGPSGGGKQFQMPQLGELIAQQSHQLGPGTGAGSGGAEGADALGKILGGLLEQLPGGGFALAGTGGRRDQSVGGTHEAAIARLLHSQVLGPGHRAQGEALKQLLASATGNVGHKEGVTGSGSGLGVPATHHGSEDKSHARDRVPGGHTITILYKQQAYMYDNVSPGKASVILQAAGVPARTWSTAPEEPVPTARAPGASVDLPSHKSSMAGVAGGSQLGLAGRILSTGVAPGSSLEGLSQALSSWRKETANSSRNQGSGSLGVGRMKVPRWAGGGVLPVLRSVSSMDSSGAGGASGGRRGRGGRAEGRERPRGTPRAAFDTKGLEGGKDVFQDGDEGGRHQKADAQGVEGRAEDKQKQPPPAVTGSRLEGEGSREGAPLSLPQVASGACVSGPGSHQGLDEVADSRGREMAAPPRGSGKDERWRSPGAASSDRRKAEGLPLALDLEKTLVDTEDSSEGANSFGDRGGRSGGGGSSGEGENRAEAERNPPYRNSTMEASPAIKYRSL